MLEAMTMMQGRSRNCFFFFFFFDIFTITWDLKRFIDERDFVAHN